MIVERMKNQYNNPIYYIQPNIMFIERPEPCQKIGIPNLLEVD
jgi:hypothetical protein